MNKTITRQTDMGPKGAHVDKSAKYVITQQKENFVRGKYTDASCQPPIGHFVGRLQNNELEVLGRFATADKHGVRLAFLKLTGQGRFATLPGRLADRFAGDRMQAEGGGVASLDTDQPPAAESEIQIGDNWISIAEYAARAGVSRQAIYERIDREVLPAKRIPPQGGLLFIDAIANPPERWRE